MQDQFLPLVRIECDDLLLSERVRAAIYSLPHVFATEADRDSSAEVPSREHFPVKNPADAAEVIVTDRAPAREADLSATSRPIGRILIADRELAPHFDARLDAQLEPDFTPRELRTAILLVARIAEMRNQLSASQLRQQSLARDVYLDPLTGLANRRAWDEQLQLIVRHESAPDTSLCIALADVDDLKRVNDRLGHMEGDRLLRETAVKLRTALRQSDFVARIGGDEFGILLLGLDAASADAILHRLRQATEIRLVDGNLARSTIGHSLSDGISADAIAQAFAHADAALLQAKRDRLNSPRASGG